ncbi:hypothetical protein LTR67_004753 [Exophiala xenobiotica]|nr:hypothetical protein H2202_010754 [Exophiala xenobiotica]KAK5210598.1 hypothetical protein LTR41_004266 [Exophiala xenobiotica]KAK5255668.1 hypothetical protein LTS06_000124 [Exophiala xenobiotica]KAK5314967.1 hypothetical protein LTR93_009969 [Exophiala xenobiotica]KAK5350177.1 hypothetical protein LTR61_006152 [Exophiala xenobiotica]
MDTAPTFMGLRGQPLIYAVTFTSSIGFLLFGYDLGFMGGLTTSTKFLNVFGNPDSALLGFIVASYEVGALLGALFQFALGDRYGRKTNNLGGAVLVVIGAILQASTTTLAQFLIGRIVGGFGLGCRMMAMQLSNLIIGLILSNWLDYGMADYSSSISWRFPCAFQIIFCILVCCLMPFLPESPRYLFRSGQVERGTTSMAALRGTTRDNPDVQLEIKEIQYILTVEAEEVGTWSDCFKDGGIYGWQRVAIAFSANFFQQLSGVNVMSSLGPYIFQTSIGMSARNALLVSGGLQVYYFLSSLIPWYTTNNVGRRKLFMIGSAGMGVCMLLSAVFVGVGTKGLGYAAAVVLYIFHTFFTLGWQSNMWIYPSEILPLKLRLRGGALAVVSQWLFTFVVVQMTPPMITNINYRSYIVFAVINFATIPCVYFFYPETLKLPLEAIDLLFTGRPGEQRPSFMQAVRNSKSQEFKDTIMATLIERADQEPDTGIKMGPIHDETAKV